MYVEILLSIIIYMSYFDCKRLERNIVNYFDFGKELGSGAFGTVNLATPRPLARKEIGEDLPSQVAIKKLRNLETPTQKALLVDEIKFLKIVGLDNKLKHACKYYGCFEQYLPPVWGQRSGNRDAATVVYLIMELIEGDSLYDTLYKKPPLTPANKEDIINQIVVGITELHALGIVHHDLKLENIMVKIPSSSWSSWFSAQEVTPLKVTLLDYGLSCYQPSPAAPMVGACVPNAGTPGYIDPLIESKDGRVIIDSLKLADWWTFGIIALEIYSHRPLIEHGVNPLVERPYSRSNALKNVPLLARRTLLTKLTDPKLEQKDRPTPQEIIDTFK
jgi:serine/threonine protein kinase